MSVLPNPQDDSLLRRWRDGSQDAARLIYERYRTQLQALIHARLSPNIANRVDAEDLVQSIFRRFFSKATEEHYHVPEGKGLWALLLVIAMNRLKSEETYQRALCRDVRRTVGMDLMTYFQGESLPLHEDTSHVLGAIIDETLNQFSIREQQIMELRIEGHDVQSIAKEVGCSKRTVERSLCSLRQKLQDTIEFSA